MGRVVTWPYTTASSMGSWWLCLAGLCPAALCPSSLSPPGLPQLGSPAQGISAELPRGGNSDAVPMPQSP